MNVMRLETFVSLFTLRELNWNQNRQPHLLEDACSAFLSGEQTPNQAGQL